MSVSGDNNWYEKFLKAICIILFIFIVVQIFYFQSIHAAELSGNEITIEVEPETEQENIEEVEVIDHETDFKEVDTLSFNMVVDDNNASDDAVKEVVSNVIAETAMLQYLSNINQGLFIANCLLTIVIGCFVGGVISIWMKKF